MRSYGEPTDTMLRAAQAKAFTGQRLTKEQALLLELADGQFHSARLLARVVSHRFGGYLHTLKEKGVRWHKRRNPTAPKGEAWWEYRLVREGEQEALW